jgi:hypothetical protein
MFSTQTLKAGAIVILATAKLAALISAGSAIAAKYLNKKAKEIKTPKK